MADAPATGGGVSPDQAQTHWRRTRGLMFTVLAIWFVFAFLVHAFAGSLNQITIIGFPLGWYMGAQGSLIVFVILCFWFGARQNRIDHECGVSED